MKIIKLYILLLFLVPLACKNADIGTLVQDNIKKREGNPSIFYLNKKEFGASNFRKELYFERKHLENNFTHPKPDEFEKYLQQYIEETIILKEALSSVDYNSPDFKNYLWPFIRKGVIAYYLEKQSGGFDLVQNYENLSVPEEVVQEYYKTHSSQFKDSDEKELMSKLKNTAIYAKWKLLYNQSTEKKKNMISKMKQQNEVKIISKEVYTLEEKND